MTEYRILSSDDADLLSRKVTELLSQGWRPQGGVVMVRRTRKDEHGFDYSDVLFAQAVVRQ